MYTVTKRMEIAGSHSLELDYESKCQNVHGHNWIITVVVGSSELNKDGMVVDFSRIKEVVNRLDHRHINDVLDLGVNPTAEIIAKWIHTALQGVLDKIKDPMLLWSPRVLEVTVQESEGNTACYIP